MEIKTCKLFKNTADVYPWYIAVPVFSVGENVQFYQQVSRNYFSKGWALRWAQLHGYIVVNQNRR